MNALDRRGIAALEATGIPWAAVERWIDELEPREAFIARTLADDKAPLRQRFEAHNELYRRLIRDAAPKGRSGRVQPAVQIKDSGRG